jgi:hypothetical protein
MGPLPYVLNVRQPIMEKYVPTFLLVWVPSKFKPPFLLSECPKMGPLGKIKVIDSNFVKENAKKSM